MNLILLQTGLAELMLELLGDMASGFMNFLGALLIFLIGWIISRVIARVVKRLLEGIGVDKLAERLNEIDLVSKAKFTIKPSEVLSKIVYYILLLVFVIAAADVLGMPAVSKLMADIINYVPNLLTAAIVLVIGVLFADFIKNIVKTACNSLGIPSGNIIASFVFYFIFIAVVMSALSQADINTEFIQNNLTVLIGGGVLAFAFGYGFASRDMMANFIASFYSKSKVQVGEKVKIGEVEGRILHMDNASITIKTSETIVIVPLSKLTSENVEKFSEWMPPVSDEEE